MIIRQDNNLFVRKDKNILVSNDDFENQALCGLKIRDIISVFDDYGIEYSIILSKANSMEDILYLEEIFSEV